MAAYWLISLTGVIPTVTILFIVLLRWKYISQKIKTLSQKQKAIHGTSVVTILLYVLAFVFLPLEVAYLLPMVPFLFLVMGMLLPDREMILLTILIVSSLFVKIELRDGSPGARSISPHISAGEYILDYRGRTHQLITRQAFDSCMPEEAFLLMYGHEWTVNDNPNWEYLPDLEIHRRKDGKLYLSKFITSESQLEKIRQLVCRIFVWEKNMWAFLPHEGTQQEDHRFLFARYVEILEELPCRN